MKMPRGASSDTTVGVKPAVAFQSESSARENIDAKLKLIVTALREGASEEMLASLPDSPRQFNLWAPPNGQGGHHKRNSNDTLKRHAALLLGVREATEAVKVARKLPTKSANRENRLATLRRDLAMHKVIRGIAERALVKARAEAQQARKDYQGLQHRMVSLEREAREQVMKLDAEIAALRTENSRLTKTLAKISPLRRS